MDAIKKWREPNKAKSRSEATSRDGDGVRVEVPDRKTSQRDRRNGPEGCAQAQAGCDWSQGQDWNARDSAGSGVDWSVAMNKYDPEDDAGTQDRAAGELSGCGHKRGEFLRTHEGKLKLHLNLGSRT
jgi:hypothetical protein